VDGASGERARRVAQLAQAGFGVETGFVTTAIPKPEHIKK